MAIRLGAFMQGWTDEDRRRETVEAKQAENYAKAKSKAEAARIKAQADFEKEKRRRFESNRTFKATEKYRKDTRTDTQAKEGRDAARLFLVPYLDGTKSPYTLSDKWNEETGEYEKKINPEFFVQALIAADGNPTVANSFYTSAVKTFDIEQAKRNTKEDRARQEFSWKKTGADRAEAQEDRAKAGEDRAQATHDADYPGQRVKLEEKRVALEKERLAFQKKKLKSEEEKKKRLKAEAKNKQVATLALNGNTPLSKDVIATVLKYNSNIKPDTLYRTRIRELEDSLQPSAKQDFTHFSRLYPIFSRDLLKVTEGNESHYSVEIDETNNFKKLPQKESKRKDVAFNFLRKANTVINAVNYKDNQKVKDLILNSNFGTDIKNALAELNYEGKTPYNLKGIADLIPKVLDLFPDESKALKAEIDQKNNAIKVQKAIENKQKLGNINISPLNLAEARSRTVGKNDSFNIPTVVSTSEATISRINGHSPDVVDAYNNSITRVGKDYTNYQASLDKFTRASVYGTFSGVDKGPQFFKMGQTAENRIFQAVVLGSVSYVYGQKGGDARNRAVEVDIINRRSENEIVEFRKSPLYKDNNKIYKSSDDGIREINRVLELLSKAESGQGYKALADKFAILPEIKTSIEILTRNFMKWISGSGNEYEGDDIEIKTALNRINNEGSDEFRDIAIATIKEAREKSSEFLEEKKRKLDAGEIEKEDYALFQRIEMAKVKLAYKMAGVFQGASSGSRTISDADFRIILESMWGTTQYGTQQKLLELRSTLNNEYLLAKATLEFGHLTPEYVHVVGKLQNALESARPSILDLEIKRINSIEKAAAGESVSSDGKISEAGVKALNRNITTIGNLPIDQQQILRKANPALIASDTKLFNLNPHNFETEIQPIFKLALDTSYSFAKEFSNLGEDVKAIRSEEIMKHLGIKNIKDPRIVSGLIDLNFAVKAMLQQDINDNWSHPKIKEFISKGYITNEQLFKFSMGIKAEDNKSAGNIKKLFEDNFDQKFVDILFVSDKKGYQQFNKRFINESGFKPSQALHILSETEKFIGGVGEFINVNRVTINYNYDEEYLNAFKQLYGTPPTLGWGGELGLRNLPTLSLEQRDEMREKFEKFSKFINTIHSDNSRPASF
tara:strand:- start:5802 stop:9200 length:3399 start_codon:yes stop_codon:yes gene_type:complete